MSVRVLCSKCGADEVICYPTRETAVCPNCCEDHDYRHDHGERAYYCQHCGAEPPDDWYYCDDDVPLFGGYQASEPVGTPAQSMDGNASNRHKNPDGWARWVAFCNSWGHP